MMKLKNYSSAIILPYKENFCDKGFGAVSIWVKDYIENSTGFNDIIFCRKITNVKKYLTSNVKPIKINAKLFTNLNYIKNINLELEKKSIKTVEIHNRPEYAIYLIKNNPKLIINLVFHNDPNLIRGSNNKKKRKLRFWPVEKKLRFWPVDSLSRFWPVFRLSRFWPVFS